MNFGYKRLKIWSAFLHRVLKTCANLFLSKLRQIYTNLDNIWQKDGKEAKIIRDALIFHHVFLTLRKFCINAGAAIGVILYSGTKIKANICQCSWKSAFKELPNRLSS